MVERRKCQQATISGQLRPIYDAGSRDKCEGVGEELKGQKRQITDNSLY